MASRMAAGSSAARIFEFMVFVFEQKKRSGRRVDKNTVFSQKPANCEYPGPECNPVGPKNHPVQQVSTPAREGRLLLSPHFAFKVFVPKEKNCTVLAGKTISHEVFRKTIEFDVGIGSH